MVVIRICFSGAWHDRPLRGAGPACGPGGVVVGGERCPRPATPDWVGVSALLDWAVKGNFWRETSGGSARFRPVGRPGARAPGAGWGRRATTAGYAATRSGAGSASHTRGRRPARGDGPCSDRSHAHQPKGKGTTKSRSGRTCP